MADKTDVVIFSGGAGVITPTDKYSDYEVLDAIEASMRPLKHPAVVCIDERASVEGKEPIREKVSGGNLNTFATAAAAIEWSGFNEEDKAGGPEQMVDASADFLVHSGETLGAHRHAHEGEEASDDSGCGAVDKGHVIDVAAGEHGAEWADQARIDLGEGFNEEHWQNAQAGFKRLGDDEAWQSLDRKVIQKTVRAKGGVVETLDADSDAFAEDVPNAELRKGHWGQAIHINHEAGQSNDRDNASIPFFEVDVDPMVRMAEKAGSSEDESSRLLHAMVMRQYATGYVLTNNMRVVR